MFGILTSVCVAATGYVYVGYPVLVHGLAAARPEEGPYPEAAPTISVVVAAFNESDVIAAKINNVLASDIPSERLQVIVVTDGSDDGTDEAARLAGGAGAGVTVIHQPERQGKARALMRGVGAATGEVVVFMDANNLCPPLALVELVRPLSDPRVGAVTGAKVVDGGVAALSSGEGLYWRYESEIKRAESRIGCCTGVIGELLAVRRDLVPSLPAGLVNDDFYISMMVARAGHKVAYAPRALSLEPTAPSAQADAIRRRRMTAGRWQSLAWSRRVLPLDRPIVVWQVVSHKYLRLALPFTMAGALLANAVDVATGIGQRRQRATRTLLVAQVAFYALAAAGPALPGPKALSSAGSAARYLVRSNVASAEGLVWYVRRRESLHLWERIDRTGSMGADHAREGMGT